MRERNMVQYSLAANTFESESQPLEYRDLDNLWHFLLVKFRKPSFTQPWQMEVYLDSLEQVNKNFLIIPLRNVDTNADHYVALGSNVDLILKHIQNTRNIQNGQTQKRSEESKGDDPNDLIKTQIQREKDFCRVFDNNISYFRGQVSLPFFFRADLRSVHQENLLARAFRDQVIEFISTKNVLNFDAQLDLGFQVYKLQKQEEAMRAIQESNNVLARNIVTEVSDDELMQSFGKLKNKDNAKVRTFHSLDKYTMQVAHLHTLAYQQRVLTSVHSRMPAEVFMCLGGFKNLYPLVENVLNSNLSQLSPLKPGLVLSWVFEILNTLLHTEPAHICSLVKTKNLLMTLKMILLELGAKQMLSVDLVAHVRNIIKKNVLARFRFVEVKGNGMKPIYFQQKYINTATGTCRANKQFYENFLLDFFNFVLLDKDFAVQSCFYINNPQVNPGQTKTQSSTTLSSMDPHLPPPALASQINSNLVIEEIIQLVSFICCPPDTKLFTVYQHRNERNPALSADAYTDYLSLREIIICRKTIGTLMELLNLPQLQHVRHTQLLTKLGKCIADAIIFNRDTESLKLLLVRIQKEKWRELSPLLLKVYLLIVFKVLKESVPKETNSQAKETNPLAKVFAKDFVKQDFAKILNQTHPKEVASDETAVMHDEVISITLLILVQHYIYLKMEQQKPELIDRVSQHVRNSVKDSDRSALMTSIQQEINQNANLRENTYYTLMLVAFEKRKVAELPFNAIPKIDDIVSIVKKTQLRMDVQDSFQAQRTTSSFNIDFFFVVLELFRKYNSATKRNFLSHIHLFLQTHQQAFMSIFEEVSNIEAQFKNKLLGFFHLIISECITSSDREISLSAEFILLEVCSFQLRSSQFDPPQIANSFIAQQQLRRPRPNNALGSHDYDGTRLLTVIFMLFKNDNNQFQVLKKLLHKVYQETYSFDETKNEKDRRLAVKLNMKLIQLLQIIESIFINKPSVAQNQHFIEALAVMMFLLNKMKIMDFALPDVVCENFYPAKERNESIDINPAAQTQVVQQSSALRTKQEEPKSGRQIQSTQARALADLGMPLRSQQIVIQKEELKVVPELKVNKDLNVSKRSGGVRRSDETKTFEFINGGSFRILLHIILRSLHSFGFQMLPEYFATYVDMLRYLMTREMKGNLRSVLLNQKQPYFEDEITTSRQSEKQSEIKLRKVNLLNKAEVQSFILRDHEKAIMLKDNAQTQHLTIANSAQSNDGSNRSLKSVLSPKQYKNTSMQVWERDREFDKTFDCHFETLEAIQDTIQAQFIQQQEKASLVPTKNIPGFNEDRQIRNNFEYLLHMGFSKRIKSILPGAGVVKGFCATMMIGELVEILHSLFLPSEERLFEHNIKMGMQSEILQRRYASPKNNPKLAFQAINELAEEENQPDEMAFEESKTKPPSRSFKKSSRGDLNTVVDQLAKDGLNEKADELLRLLYELLNEQLFEMPLSISKNDSRPKARSARQDRPEPIPEDISKDAGRVFWDAIDQVLRQKFKAELDFFTQNKMGCSEAKKKVTFICSPLKQQTTVVQITNDGYFNQVRNVSNTLQDTQFSKTMSNNILPQPGNPLIMSSDNAALHFAEQQASSDGINTSELDNPSDQSPLHLNDGSDEELQLTREEEMDERQSFVKDFMEQKKDSAFQSDNQIRKFVSQLFSMLHALYGNNTKIIPNEFGGFDQKYITSDQEFPKPVPLRSSAGQLAEIIDFLTKNQLVSVSFVGASSDLFKNDLQTAYSIARRNLEKQQLEEKQFEQTRSEAIGRRSAMSFDLGYTKVFSSQQFAPSTFKVGLQEHKFSSDEKLMGYDNPAARQDDVGVIEFRDDNSGMISRMYSLDYLYTKKQFKRIVKWCCEDPSNLWYDHMEQALAEFAEAKQIYKSEVLRPDVQTCETSRQKNFKEMLELYSSDKSVQETGEKKTKLQLFNDYRTNYGEIYVNPQFHNCFVKQRQQIDRWGRKLLTKPNRKYDQGDAWRYYKYVAQEYLNKVFAVSLLEDGDQNDCVIAQSDHDEMLLLNQDNDISPSPTLGMFKIHSELVTSPSGPPLIERDLSQEDALELALQHYEDSPDENGNPKQFSKNLQRLRNDLFTRLDRSRLLQSVIFGEQKQPVASKTEEEKKQERNFFINAIKQQEVPLEFQALQTDDFKVFDAILYHLFMYYGNVITTPDYLVFLAFGLEIPHDNYIYIRKDVKLDEKRHLILRWGEIEELLVRPCYGPMMGLEVYTCHKKHYSFNLLSPELLKDFLSVVKTYKQQRKFSFNIVDDPVEFFKERGFAEAWKNGEKSNQEFLLLLNKYSGRTFNTQTQYPFFPHILMNFDTNLLEFHEKDNKSKVYRDLKKNTLCIVPAKEKWFEEHLNSLGTVQTQEGSLDAGYQIKVSYGFVGGIRTIQPLHRLEPFSSWYLGINGQTENPDRLQFDSNMVVADQTNRDKGALNTELNPEFFYLPEILTNENHVHFGIGSHYPLQNKDQWFLPRWALNHYDMVRIYRESLESKYVQQNLGSWIDLIFGCDQFNAAKFNQCYPWMYPEFWKKEKMYQDWQERRTHEDITSEMDRELDTEFMPHEIATVYQLLHEGYQVPLKLFSEPIMQAEKEKPQATQNPDEASTANESRLEEEKISTESSMVGKKGPGMLNIDNLINHFVNNFENPTRADLKLNRCADYQVLDHSHDIVHQIIISLKKECLAFLRIEDKKAPKELLPKAVPTGKIVVYKSRVNISKDTFLPKDQKDLFLRYEHVHHELENIFAEFSCKHEKCTYKERGHLYVCGYLDNSIKIFDLMMKSPGKPLVKELRMNNARVTCIKFSKDCKYLITCDADGVIHHFEKNCHTNDHADIDTALNSSVGPSVNEQAKKDNKKGKEHFPFTLLHVFQDQMDEIVAIDINETLDMYATISRDGTIALRCLRTSKLWRQFKILYRNESKQQEDGKAFQIKGYTKNFCYINSLKLSLHGYIFVCGPASRTPGVSQYMVYSLNGDLLRAALEKVEIKNVFLNSREDQVIIATNYVDQKDSNSKEPKFPKNVKSNLRVLNLYGLDRVANLTKIVYSETKAFLEQQNENGTEIIAEPTSRETPSIQSMAIGLGERNINIFYVKKQIDAKGVIRQVKNESKEIICFDSGMDAVWSHFKNYGIAR